MSNGIVHSGASALKSGAWYLGACRDLGCLHVLMVTLVLFAPSNDIR